jgi:hypothetical protein
LGIEERCNPVVNREFEALLGFPGGSEGTGAQRISECRHVLAGQGVTLGQRQ